MLISVVIPVFNNENSLKELVKSLDLVFQNLTSTQFEVIFVDDGSMDGSCNLLKELKDLNEKTDELDFVFRIIKHAGNYGQTKAILTGLANARGDAAIIMSADLQEDPEKIRELVEGFEKGFEVVIAERMTREDPKVFSKIAYFLIRRKHPGFPKGGFDFYLISRRIYSTLSNLPHGKYRWLQTEIWNLKVKHKAILYKRNKRKFGKSSHSFSSRFLILSIAIMDSSPILIRSLLVFGAILLFFALITIATLFIGYFGGNIVLPGYVTLFATLTLMNSLQILMLGSIGEYIWRIYSSQSIKSAVIMSDEI